MEKNPHIVFFYMIGCPHCEHARPMWESMKKDIPSGIAVVEIESAEAPSRVQGYPRFERTDESGGIIAVVEGAPSSSQDLKKKLKIKKSGGTRRRRSTRRLRHTRRRKF